MNCEICNGESGKDQNLREMMFGSRKEFDYWECLGCGCLQAKKIPENLGDYYPENYYSFSKKSSRLRDWARALYYRAYLGFPGLVNQIHSCPIEMNAIFASQPKAGARILDVGSGSGDLVIPLRDLGYDAWGIDPFLKVEQPFVKRKSLDEVEGQWDLIMFHHVLEHMTNHAEVLGSVRSKLGKEGTCLVRIPLSNWAWQHYGRDWVQLDAPRHLVIHSEQSFRLLAAAAGFEIVRVIFDSTEFQFWASELYKQDRQLQGQDPRELFSKEQLKEFRDRAAELNRKQAGDQVAFLLKPA